MAAIHCTCFPPQLEAFLCSSHLSSEEPALDMFENSLQMTLLLKHTSKVIACLDHCFEHIDEAQGPEQAADCEAVLAFNPL